MPVVSLRHFLADHPDAVLIEITAAQGSTPREAGAFMLVAMDGFLGTIGGGQLEYRTMENARKLIKGDGGVEAMDIPLGPEIGQCCGGRAQLRFRKVTDTIIEELQARCRAAEETFAKVYIFGGGHVGRALALAMAPLPLSLTLIETREEKLVGLPDRIITRLTAIPEALVETIPPAAALIIVTHDHALDFLIAREALARDDLAYTGMIGSLTKRAKFSSWLAHEGDGDKNWLSRLTLPIGGGAVKNKRPEVIAAMTVAEVLTALENYRSERGT
ncbi:xanthine dehydrogenase accessory protein XdhC [Phyllobacterium leguminum]|uniref:Molybdenum cofactor sulfurylase n=1 Tax=Phyllobacterium leguminum TaxID=314237 RepID=A0A318TFK2_9HYPH|nr:xanthine dehydrogenase accessory protein XdhC [Phyllobacterium leguminum]PYE87285.1 molybdenum cofactor sulfurylase [Phyllobacterium leguminum]